MGVSGQTQLERAELDSVLQSGIFNRAPNLASFLKYVGERYLEGHADQIKEYSIAVEALGRPRDFDQKKDSIVRVEAHRLRKRLADYYQGPGASHPVHIVIPNGQYVPHFVPVEAVSANGKEPPKPVSTEELVSAPPFIPSPVVSVGDDAKHPIRVRRLLWVICICILGVVVAVKYSRWVRSDLNPSNDVRNEALIEPASELHMLAGYRGTPFSDRQGRVWVSDAFFTGGNSIPAKPDRIIQGLPDPAFLKAKREGRFRYDIPLRKGVYELHLYFAETEYGYGNPSGGGETSRLFRISINEKTEIPFFDVLAEAGAPNRLHERVFKDISPGDDGKLHLNFEPISAPAFLNALEILPSLPNRIRPIRIVARKKSVTDGEGQLWSADRYVIGGSLVLRRDGVLNVREEPLYHGERYGNFAYHIPVAPGKYRVTLYFAETWFGTPESGQPATGSRLFSVFANGVTLLRNFDIAQEAGGMNRGIKKVFEHLEPNAQGKLVLEFVPVQNYACVNAIEIVETD